MFGKSSLRFISTSMVILTVVFAGLAITRPARALDGLPGSPQFGYGARLDIRGQGIRPAIDLASGMNFSWLLIDFDWAFYWPDPNLPPIYDQLDSVITLVDGKNINIVISLSNPPAWAIGNQGPIPERTSQLVLNIATRYPGAVLAFELFPGANTVSGWSSSPSPRAYTALLHTIYRELFSAGLDIQLITTLCPISPGDTSENIPDSNFLIGLYESNWQTVDAILGIRYSNIIGDPLTLPSNTEIPVLRHYEELRNILVENQDISRLIWITGFSWPIEITYDTNPASEQANWLIKAYRLLTAQLYIGAAFFDQLNPNASNQHVSSLLLPDDSLHPVCATLSQLTNPNNVIIPIPDNDQMFLSSIPKVILKYCRDGL